MKEIKLTPVPLGERVIVEPVVPEVESELFLADSKVPPPNQGIVKAVSEEVTSLKIGDMVQFNIGAGVPLIMVDNTYLLMRLGDVICKYMPA